MSLSIGADWTRAAVQNPAPSAAPVSTPSQPSAKAQKAARDFEVVMLSTLLEPLQKSFGGGLDDGTTGSAEYGSMGTQALATAMAARGGIGIAQLVLRHLGDTKVPTAKGTEVSAQP